MTEPRLSNEDERRLTTVENLLEDHIKTCEANSKETKYWTRFLGGAAILFLAKFAWTWATTGHIPG